ncbi:GntR family transcriptional regulator [Roseomonas sp. GC11]|uniref:GntR family transcriptional regulator n=1 Tax=Roseomonas sp. GC11 TaxID=2950546 RepID=UPI002108C10A|nr:GntR family transcriptional regulator [Roseomonas sp. GC11]MCQ4159275.1 GntR family transcriptional regulator [Roseomonas sp. GC11]
MLPPLTVELPKTLSTLVEERLREAIVNGELAFGQALSEDAVGLSLGVSRTPMREALTRLEQQGLVVIQPKKGSFVFRPTLEDVGQLASFRLMLENGAVERCLEGDAAATLADLRAAFAAMGAARAARDGKAYARADTAFHAAFFTHCGNVHLAHAYRGIAGRVAALRAHLSVPRSDQQDLSFREHGQIIGAFAAADLPALRGLMAAHILRAQAVYAEALRG